MSAIFNFRSFFKKSSFLAFIFFLQAAPLLAELKNGKEADLVLGQTNFETTSSGISRTKFNLPVAAVSDGRRFFVVDALNNRVLIWNSIPTVNNSPPDVVLGQPNFETRISATTQRDLTIPAAMFSNGKQLFIGEEGNRRILIYHTIPTTSYAPADVVLGQPDFTSTSLTAPTRQKTGAIEGVFSDGKILIASDYSNNRVLIWKSIPTKNFVPADIVLGQPDFETNSLGTSATKMNGPTGVYYDGQKLFVTEIGNNRVLIWNKLPTSNFTSADVVIGQPNFSSNVTGAGSSGVGDVYGVFADGSSLFVTDYTNSRVLGFRKVPTKNNTPADFVLGQSLFEEGTERAGRTGLNNPVGLHGDGRHLFVADYENHRVLIYNLFNESAIKRGPQFEQGKGVLGKVFWDSSSSRGEKGDGIQNKDEKGIEGVKIVSDTGIYAITDEDGKYHFPYLETGQRVLKIDKDTLPEDSEITTDNPYHVVVTEGVLTKVSFGVKQGVGEVRLEEKDEKMSSIMLKVSVAQESSQLKPRLGVTVEMGKEKQEGKLVFTIDCNYFLFIKRSELKIYDQNQKLVKTIELPQPVPLYHELPVEEITSLLREEDKNYRFHYQVSVYDSHNAEDRTSIGSYHFTRYQV